MQRTRINPSRKRLEDFIVKSSVRFPSGSKVLDAGSGEGFYRHHFSHCVYHSTDLQKYQKTYGLTTYLSDLSTLPIENDSYEYILCTQVLEHVPDPDRVMNEFFRVLKPGGELWLSAAFSYAEHEVPYDFFRYTRFGLRFLAEKAGFRILEIDWLEGYFGSLAYQFDLAARLLPTKVRTTGAISAMVGQILLSVFLLAVRCISFIFSLILSRLELHYKLTEQGFGKNCTMIAVKPTG